MKNFKEHLNLLGLRVKDRVTGFSGVVASVNFDLYGCIQASVNPGLDKYKKLGDQAWFDVNRLAVISDETVMDRPEYDWAPEKVASGAKGAAEKPRFNKA